MRRKYLDNIRWMTVVLVVIYHILYMYNAEGILGTIGKITNLEVQYYDVYQYVVYPWFMCILFVVSGICSRMYLEKHTGKEFARSRTRKLSLIRKRSWQWPIVTRILLFATTSALMSVRSDRNMFRKSYRRNCPRSLLR